MSEALYADRPDVYDALYADKEYDAEVEFVVEQFEAKGNGGDRALVVGCGTGEHSTRLRERGFEVTGVDRYEAMVERARTKSDAEFRVGRLPDLPVDDEFDLVFLPFTVVDHLPPEAFAPSLRSLADALADDGLLVFDTMGERPPEPTALQLYTYDRPEGTYARLVQKRPFGDRRVRWDSLVVTPDGDVFADVHDLTDYDRAVVVGALEVLGLSVETFGWYGDTEQEGYDATVFVASAGSGSR